MHPAAQLSARSYRSRRRVGTAAGSCSRGPPWRRRIPPRGNQLRSPPPPPPGGPSVAGGPTTSPVESPMKWPARPPHMSSPRRARPRHAHAAPRPRTRRTQSARGMEPLGEPRTPAAGWWEPRPQVRQTGGTRRRRRGGAGGWWRGARVRVRHSWRLRSGSIGGPRGPCGARVRHLDGRAPVPVRVPHGSSARCGCGRGRSRSTRARPSPTQRASESPRNIVHITLGCRRPPCPCFRKMCGQAAARARCRPGDDGSWMDAAKARRGASLAGSLAVKPNNHRKRAGAGHVEAAGGVRDGDGQRWMELVVACVARGCSPRSDGRSDRMDGLWSVRAWGSRGVPREGP
jgi:hypothetical protein